MNETHVLETLEGYEVLKNTLAEVELEVLTEGYTLADAIREGSAATKQKVGGFYDVEANEACALSAAYMACRARGLV